MHFWTLPNFFFFLQLILSYVRITRTYFAAIANLLCYRVLCAGDGLFHFTLFDVVVHLASGLICHNDSLLHLTSFFSRVAHLSLSLSLHVVEIELPWMSCATQITRSGKQLNKWPSRHRSHHHCRSSPSSARKKPNEKWEELKLICDFVVCT